MQSGIHSDNRGSIICPAAVSVEICFGSLAPGMPSGAMLQSNHEPHARPIERRVFGMKNYRQFVAGEPVCLGPSICAAGTDQALTSRKRQAFRSSDLDRFPADIVDLVAEARFDRTVELLQTRRMLGNRRQEQLVLEV